MIFHKTITFMYFFILFIYSNVNSILYAETLLAKPQFKEKKRELNLRHFISPESNFKYRIELSELNQESLDLMQEFKKWGRLLNQASQNSDSSLEPAQDHPWSLAELEERAFKGSEEWKVIGQNIKLANQMKNEALLNLLPAISVEAQSIKGSTIGEDFRGNGVKLALEQPLWDWGEKWDAFKRAKLNVALAELRLAEYKQQIALRVSQAYFNLWEAHQNRNLYERGIAEGESILNAARERARQHLIREIDFQAVLNQYEKLEFLFQQSKHHLQLSEFVLSNEVEFYQLTPVQIDWKTELELKIKPLSDYLESVLENRAEYRTAKLRVKLARSYKMGLEKRKWGRVNLEASVGYRAEAFDSETLDYETEYFVGINGSLPFFGQLIESQTLLQDSVPAAGQTTSTDFQSQSIKWKLFGDKKSVRLEAELNYRKAVAELNKVKKKILFDTGKAYFDLHQAKEYYLKAENQKRFYKKRYQFMTTRVSLNEAGLEELFKSLIQALEGEAELNRAKISTFKADRLLRVYFDPISFSENQLNSFLTPKKPLDRKKASSVK